MRAGSTEETRARGIVRASALPAVALTAAPPLTPIRPPTAQSQPVATQQEAAAPQSAAWPRRLAPLRSRVVRMLAFDAAVLGALLSFVTELVVLGAGQAAIEGGRAMLLSALLLTTCWLFVLSADVRRLLTLVRRWR